MRLPNYAGLAATVTVSSASSDVTATDLSVSAGTFQPLIGTTTTTNTISYESMLNSIPQEVIKEYYLRHFTKLGRKLSGEE
jgi:hypothetical protein